MKEESSWVKRIDLSSGGRELGAVRGRAVRTVIRSVLALVGMTGAGSALAQGGICLSNCGDAGQTLEPISVSAFIGVWDPCGSG